MLGALGKPGLGSVGTVEMDPCVPESLDPSLPFLVTVADYISRAESQSRQRPPLECTKPSEDSLSGQKVGSHDTAYPILFFFIFGQGHRKLV